MTRFTRLRGLGFALAAVFLLAMAPTSGFAASSVPSGTFSVKYDNASLLFSFSTGNGTLVLNDGREYAITIDGYGIGALGFSEATAEGKVYDLNQPADFTGEYSVTGASYSMVEGKGNARLKNRANNVTLEVTSSQSGLRVGVGAGFVTLRLGKLIKEAPPPPAVVTRQPAPVAVMKKSLPPPAVVMPLKYELQFGFNKSRVSLAMGRYLDIVVADWKGKPVTFRVIGHADMVGSTGYNRKLSQARAVAVKNALSQRGIPASAITATGVGQSGLAVPTKRGVRKRENRRAVITIVGAK